MRLFAGLTIAMLARLEVERRLRVHSRIHSWTEHAPRYYKALAIQETHARSALTLSQMKWAGLWERRPLESLTLSSSMVVDRLLGGDQLP